MGLFFTLALGLTWALQLPALLARQGWIAGTVERYMLPAALAGFAPLVAALICTRRDGLPLKTLFRAPRVKLLWYPAALLMSGSLYVLGALIYRTVSGDSVRLLYLPEQPAQLVVMLLIPLAEEPGWRGYAMPRLVRKVGALPASLWLGLAWSSWHLVMFALQGMNTSVMLWGLLHVLAGGVTFGWLFQRTRGSVWIAIIAHVGAHLNNPVHALPDCTPMIINAVSTCALAALLALDRAAWSPRSSRSYSSGAEHSVRARK